MGMYIDNNAVEELRRQITRLFDDLAGFGLAWYLLTRWLIMYPHHRQPFKVWMHEQGWHQGEDGWWYQEEERTH